MTAEERQKGSGERSRTGRARNLKEEDVRALAYELYERRRAGGKQGDPLSDWLEAERLLRERKSRRAPRAR